MLYILPKQLDSINSHCSKSLAGEICRIIEEFQKNNYDLNKESNVNLLKDLIKNKIFESGRNQKRLIEQFSAGVTHFNIEFQKPTL